MSAQWLPRSQARDDARAVLWFLVVLALPGLALALAAYGRTQGWW